MLSVIRRLGVLVVLVFVLAGCAGAERAAVTVGDRSMSREDLMGFTRLDQEISQGASEVQSTVDAQRLRSNAQVIIEQYAQLEALEDVGVVATAAEREAAAQRLKSIIDTQRQAAANGEVAPVSEFVAGYAPSSPGYEFVIDLFSMELAIASNPDLTPLIRTEDVAAYFESASVESRIGIWDPTVGTVLRPSGISDADAAILEQEAQQALLAEAENN